MMANNIVSKVRGLVMGALPFCLLTLLPSQATATETKSPNGLVVLNFNVEQGRPVYSVTFKGRDVIRPSHLGLELARDKHASKGLKETDLMDGFTLKSEQTSTFDETWKPVWGETRDIRNHYNEYAAVLQQQTEQRQIVLRFRVYDDGVGFRYEFPQQPELNYFLIQDERTEFAMAGDHTAWWLPGDYDTQEQETQQSKLSEIRGRFNKAVNWGNSSVAVFSETGVQTALQMKSQDGLYINIHEAACLDYATMHLELVDAQTKALSTKLMGNSNAYTPNPQPSRYPLPQPFTFVSHLTPDATGLKGAMQTPCETPWRTIIVSDDARGMLSSNRCQITKIRSAATVSIDASTKLHIRSVLYWCSYSDCVLTLKRMSDGVPQIACVNGCLVHLDMVFSLCAHRFKCSLDSIIKLSKYLVFVILDYTYEFCHQ